MRNLFDYYSQSENQLTHALFSVLDNDRKLLAGFVRDVCGVDHKDAINLSISVQRYPFSRSYEEAEIEDRNIPDAWIFNDDFALVFEAKITAGLTAMQLSGHEKVAGRFFEKAHFFTIAAGEEMGRFENWQPLTWRAIYIWLRGQSNVWAKHAADYFEILEARMQENGQLGEEELTSFTGFPDNADGYSYLVARSTLKKAMKELRMDQRLTDELGMNPGSLGRGAITGRQTESVWDYLSIDDHAEEKGFTSFMHLTLGIGSEGAEAMVTVPHRINTKAKNKIKALGKDGFRDLCKEILENMRVLMTDVPGAVPTVRGIQRRYPSQKSIPFIDALIEADLRTAFENSGVPKYQPQWLDAVFDAFVHKNSNYQFQIGVYFKHGQCSEIYRDNALDLISRSWLACEPLISLCREM